MSRLAGLLIYVLLTASSATYIPWNGQGPVADVSSFPSQKSNNAELDLSSVQRRRHKPIFRNDAVYLIILVIAALSYAIVRLSVRPSVCPSVCHVGVLY